MNFSIFAFAVLAGFQAQARTINCMFTEPFYYVSVNEETRQLIFENPLEEQISNYEDVVLKTEGVTTEVSFGDPKGEIWNLVYTNDGQGNDGMSDRIYPFSAVLKRTDSGGHTGGCEIKEE